MKSVRRKTRSKFKSRKTSNKRYKIPKAVQNAAKKAIKLKQLGFHGGTETGHKRARQLERGGTVSEHDYKVIRAWYARHQYVSKPGYNKWVKAGRPLNDTFFKSHGSVYAWLSWGGDAGLNWTIKKSSRKH